MRSRARTCSSSGPQDAETHYLAVVAKKPEMFDAQLELGQVLESLGRWDDAQKRYAIIAEKAPKTPGLLERQAMVAVQLKQEDVRA